LSLDGLWDFLRREDGAPFTAEESHYFALLLILIGVSFVHIAIKQWRGPVNIAAERREQQWIEHRYGRWTMGRHLRPEERWVRVYGSIPNGVVFIGAGMVNLTDLGLSGNQIFLGAAVGVVAGLPGLAVAACYPRLPEWMVPPRRRDLWRLRLAQDAHRRLPYRRRRRKAGRVLPAENRRIGPVVEATDPVGSAERPWSRRRPP